MDAGLKPNTTEYKNAFRNAHYDQIAIAVPKGEKAIWQKFAKSQKKSLGAFISEAVREKIEREGGNNGKE